LKVLASIAVLFGGIPAFAQAPPVDCLPRVIHIWYNRHDHKSLWKWVGDHYEDPELKDGSQIYVVTLADTAAEFQRRNSTGSTKATYSGKVVPVGVIQRIENGKAGGLVGGNPSPGKFDAEWYSQDTVGSCGSGAKATGAFLPPIIKVTMAHNDGIFRWYNDHYEAIWPTLNMSTRVNVSAFSPDFVEFDREAKPATAMAQGVKAAVYVGKLSTKGDQINIEGTARDTPQGPDKGFWRGSWPVNAPLPRLDKATSSINDAGGIWEGEVQLPDKSSYRVRIDLQKQDSNGKLVSGREIIVGKDKPFRVETKVTGSVEPTHTGLTLKEEPLKIESPNYWCFSNRNEFVASGPGDLRERPSDNILGDDPCARDTATFHRDQVKSDNWSDCSSPVAKARMEFMIKQELDYLADRLNEQLKEDSKVRWKPELERVEEVTLSEQTPLANGWFTCEAHVSFNNRFSLVAEDGRATGQTVSDSLRLMALNWVLNQIMAGAGNFIFGNTSDGLRHFTQEFLFTRPRKGYLFVMPSGAELFSTVSEIDRTHLGMPSESSTKR
jgi:hypothetical protein